MEELVQNAINALLAYPEAPLVLGLIGLIFLISFIFVTRELTGWYFKTSRILSQNQRLEDELKAVSQRIEVLTEQVSKISLGSSFESFTEELQDNSPPSPATKKEKGFPLSH